MRRPSRRGMLVWAAVVLALAGCTQAPGPLSSPPGPDDGPPAEPPFSWALALEGCVEGGAVSVYNEINGVPGADLPAPWIPADIRHELGDPKVSSIGVPVVGRASGHWHISLVCASGTFEDAPFDPPRFGWVGEAVEAPEWDPGGADRHFLLSGFSLPPGPASLALVNGTGAHITPTIDSRIERTADASVYQIHHDEHKGIYEGRSGLVGLRSLEPSTTRWWMTVHGENDTFVPVYFDVVHSSPGDQAVSPDNSGVGCHSGTDMHGPQGGLCQNSVVTLYDWGPVELRWGGLGNATLEQEWIH